MAALILIFVSSDSDRWHRCREILAAFWEFPTEVQEQFLSEQATGDAELLAELRSLSAAERAEKIWQAAPGKSFLESRGRLGPYEIERVVGRGAMGAVYLAHRADGQFDQRIAIKVIGLPFDLDSFRERFRRERQILATLSHPNITRLLDGGTTEDGELYLVMEHIDGLSITRFAADRKLSTAERLRMFRQVCAGVEFAHQNLIIHRDIKPSNILVDSSGTPKLLDFGTAKVMADSDATLPGVAGMTVAYASPEQLGGQSVSTLTDVFSLGPVLYELLTGKKMFGENLAARIAGNDNWDPAALDSDLQCILRKAVANDPARRYSSAAQLSDDLQRYLDGAPVVARSGARAYRVAKFVKRHAAPIALAALMACVLLGATIYSAQQARGANRQTDKANQFRILMLEMLSPAKPEFGGQGAAVRLSDVLDAAVASMNKKSLADPDIEAEMCRFIGRAYATMGEADKAIVQFRRDAELQMRIHPGDHPQTAAALTRLGNREIVKTGAPAIYRQGEKDLRTAVAMWERLEKRRGP